MRRLITLLMLVGLVASLQAAPAVAGKRKPKKTVRTVEFEYVCPCTGFLQLGSLTGGDPNFGGGPVAVGAESFVSIIAEDASGQAVLVSINQDTNGDGFNDPVADVCATGERGKPAKIVPGAEMRLFISTGRCADGSPSVPLGGTLTLSLSNLP